MGKRTRNLLIVALVLFLCCFGGSIGNPFGSDDDSEDNPVVKFLGRFADEANAVPDSEIQASCRTGPDRFQFNTTCTLNVAAGGAGLRNVILTSTKAMKVTSTVPGKDFTASDDFAAGETVKVAIGEEGGAVTLACAPLQTCVVTRGNGS
jgi:hypothetical protein